jgi:ADP-heptose:LPS heptosyltransferase
MSFILFLRKMNKKQKVAIDRFVGYGLSIALRIPAMFLEWALRRDHVMPPHEPPKKIVVAKYLGIGSIVQATPVLKGLKEKYPESQLTFISLKSNKGLLSRYDFIDDILCVDDASISKIAISSFRVIADLIRRKIDLFLDLEVHSTYGSLMCLLSCARNRLGFSLGDEDHRAFLYTHLLYLNTGFPIRYCYGQLGQLAGMAPLPPMQELVCPAVSEAEVEQVRTRIETLFDFEHKGIIAINPNASDLRFERRWSRESFAAVAKYFSDQGYVVALVGASSEHAYVQGIVEQLGNDVGRVRNVAGMFSLIEFFAFLEKCCLVITNDSGVMNMALTLPVPMLLLAGPVDPEQYFIPNAYRAYIYHQTYCSPCTHYLDTPPCAGDNVCMQQILSKEVIEYSERLLRGEHVQPKRSACFSRNSEIFGVLKHMGKS